jgi:ubiquinol-cytochrome c reductase iron-sulfur subunit
MAAESGRAVGGAEGETRRDFLGIVAWSGLGIGAVAVAWPLINSMNPSADVLALASTGVDIAGIDVGMGVTVMWRGKPVFIRHRTGEEIAAAEATDLGELRDPQTDADRVLRPEWLVLVGVCPHLGCVPGGTRPGEARGDWGGWFCPCHGSHFDTSGRIRRGPSPTNLEVPPYDFETDTRLVIG